MTLRETLSQSVNGRGVTAEIRYDDGPEVEVKITGNAGYGAQSGWQIRGKNPDTTIYCSGDQYDTEGTFDATNGKTYYFQAVWGVSSAVSDGKPFTVSFGGDSGDDDGGDSGDDDGGGGSNTVIPRTLYVNQGEGTVVKVRRSWPEHRKCWSSLDTGESVYCDGEDTFYIEVIVSDGYEVDYYEFEGLQVPYILENFTYLNTVDDRHYYRLQYDADATVTSTAHKIGSSASFKKGAYIGVNNVARKIKKGYIGVNGVARKIKKAYIGIGGVARPCWGEKKLEYYGPITNLSKGRIKLAATHIGNYALFGGGEDDYSADTLSTVDAYDTSLTRTTPTGLSVDRADLAATHIGNYALFGGGLPRNYNCVNTVDAYDTSLTRTTPTGLSVARHQLAATHVGNYALFGGGDSSSNSRVNTVDAYDTSLTRTTPTGLSAANYLLAATHVGDYALFGGGSKDYLGISVYDTSLTRTMPTGLTAYKYSLAATHVGDYALFGGGKQSTDLSNIDAYDTSLTKTIPTGLNAYRQQLAATHIGNYALFGGGYTLITYDFVSTVDAYDTSLTRTTPTGLYNAAYKLAATHVGDYALFGGGSDGDGKTDTVTAYTVI